MKKVNTKLHQYFQDALQLHSEKIYLKNRNGEYSYRQVYDMAEDFHRALINNGIQNSDRVLIYSSKNAASVAMMIACSLCDCIYVPVSSMNPALRVKYILEESSARFVLCDDITEQELNKIELTTTRVLSDSKISLFKISHDEIKKSKSTDAGFILFTSGSTGTPKGVVISHAAAIAFIDWASDAFKIVESDILASIAPFNFDLSVFDIYVTAKKGATLMLYTEEETKNAMLMAQNISLDKVTTVYGTPTFFSTLAHYGKMHKYDYTSLKNVLFAGEVFQLENFKVLLSFWPEKKYSNLYGPTETNVCTYFNIDTQKIDYPNFPIGKSCEYASVLIIDEKDKIVTEKNAEGELIVTGRSLFIEYWNDEQKTSASLFFDEHQNRYYKTGDIVYKDNNNNLVYVARKDRMIKKNGFRIEPSEIEKVMLNYRGASNSSVIFSENDNQLICFIECSQNKEQNLVNLKNFCQNFLPFYMIPDKFVFLESLPKTSSGKVDLQALRKQL